MKSAIEDCKVLSLFHTCVCGLLQVMEAMNDLSLPVFVIDNGVDDADVRPAETCSDKKVKTELRQKQVCYTT